MRSTQEWKDSYCAWFHAVAEPYWKYWAGSRARLRTERQWHQRRNYLKAVFIDALGGLPCTRTPLNPRCLGRVEAAGYVLERVVFESVPELLVTANVYLPATPHAPAPAILVACGHAENGKAYEEYRRLCTSLALKGYVVLTYDPIGQGERYMYVGEDGLPRCGTCTNQHTHLGIQLAVSGISLARYMIWDSVRAVDYLLSRPEVDPLRIGMTGCSGGGTNTAYTAALDERIKAAMPACYITTIEQRQRSGIIADYEQNLYGQVERGLDHHDYAAMVAPRALCIGATTEDFFPLPGVEETFAEARRIYELLGVPERCELFVAEGGHGYLPELRRAAYAFFNRWLGVASDDEEPDVNLVDEEDTLCFRSGLRAENTFRVLLHAARLEAAELAEQQLRGAALREEIAQRVGHVPELVSAQEWSLVDGYEEASVNPSGAPQIQVLRSPGKQRVSTVLLVDSYSEARTALASGRADAAIILPLAQEPDLRKRAQIVGALEPPANFPWIHSAESFCAFYCQLLGRDWIFVRTAQVLAGLKILGRGPLTVRARGLLGLPALYATALDERVAELVIHESLWSYADALECDLHVLAPADVPWAVAGNHDLPAVMALIAPRCLRIVNPRGPDGKLLVAGSLRGLDQVREAFRELGAEDHFELRIEGIAGHEV